MLAFSNDVYDVQKSAKTSIEVWYRGLSNTPLNKVEYFSSVLFGSVYELTALGEGLNGNYDQYPLYRTDAFDCQTYVETVLALSCSESFPTFFYNKCYISYQGKDVSFLNRAHFICMDWQHLLSDNPRLRDITQDLAANHCQLRLYSSSVLIDRFSWIQSRRDKFMRVFTQLSQVDVEEGLRVLYGKMSSIEPMLSKLVCISCKDLFKLSHHERRDVLMSIPSGCVMLIIRTSSNLSEQSQAVTHALHLGFLIHKNNEVLFRHASREKGCVTDELCEDYLFDFMKHTPSIGIIVYQVL
ncbi:MAG: hypothetical protein CL816_03170 [Coxiellaceae bacterium]|nr:hypothetical protein [Coxiellaceae bacterium]|tara:strand:- start:3752 stop:4645 length:894 start_codon:yes stop_codon:yes gene_type:complete